ncbi:MAG: IS4 family transposase [Candidatus Marsarchaeota archaeon]|nr:IS4 family transposase [Candidatus Marsarchaeota archaeon]
MTSITGIAEKMQTVLTTTADSLARETGFVQRLSKVTASAFCQTCVLGWLKNPAATLDELAVTAAGLGLSISPPGLHQRFTREAATLLQEVLQAVVSEVVRAEPVAISILNRFAAVIVHDSSIISLPSALAEIWQGCGNGGDEPSAALKIQVGLDLRTGALQGPILQNGRSQDRTSPLQGPSGTAKVLHLNDLGYFSLDNLQELGENGEYYLSRLQAGTVVFDKDGTRVDLLTLLQQQGVGVVDIPVLIGLAHRLPMRLVAARVPEGVANERRRKLNEKARKKGQRVSQERLRLADWTIYVTNVPEELLSWKDAMVMARVRWQIELLFKLWKQHGRIDEWRSNKPWRILCEVYAKLIAMVLQHWLLLVCSWRYPDRSMVKAAQVVRDNVGLLVGGMRNAIPLTVAIEQIRVCVAAGCRMNRRRKKPNTYQLLLDLQNVP